MVSPREFGAFARSALRTYGVKGIARRIFYEVKLRTGRLVRLSGSNGNDSTNLRLYIDHTNIEMWHRSNTEFRDIARNTADEILSGEMSIYGGKTFHSGWPPDWNRHPSTDQEIPLQHWSKLSHAGSIGDVKDVWEIGRFCWAERLIRASGSDANDRYCEAFSVAITSFLRESPIDMGIQWMSGQEIAIRGISLLFSWSMLSQEQQTEELRRKVEQIVVPSAYRVASTLGYAASQRNNHYIVEASFLWSAAAACRGIEGGDRLLRHASDALMEAVLDQFAADGSYAQYSFTYQRLALHSLLFVDRVSTLTGLQPPLTFQPLFARCCKFLEGIMDVQTGQMPNLGSNDGSLLFQLTDLPIHDFRPFLVHLALAAEIETHVSHGQWDEEAAWFGYNVNDLRPTEQMTAAPTSASFHVLRGDRSKALLRAGSLRHRLGHADQLNLDLWIDGVNVARDPGTFRYTAPQPWSNSLANDDVHNLARPEGAVMARRRGRFFWLDWPEAFVLVDERHEGADLIVAEVSYLGYRCQSRRLVARSQNCFTVIDRVIPIHGAVRWNLPCDSNYRQTERGVDVSGEKWWLIVSGAPGGGSLLTPQSYDPTSGWESSTYGELSPVTAVQVRTDNRGQVLSIFGPTDAEPPDDHGIQILRAVLENPSTTNVQTALNLLAL